MNNKILKLIFNSIKRYLYQLILLRAFDNVFENLHFLTIIIGELFDKLLPSNIYLKSHYSNLKIQFEYK